MFLHRVSIRPRHLDDWLATWPQQLHDLQRHGFTHHQAYLQAHAEPKLTCLMEHRDSLLEFDALDRLEHLERSAEHRTLATSMAPHVFRNRVVRGAMSDPWVAAQVFRAANHLPTGTR